MYNNLDTTRNQPQYSKSLEKQAIFHYISYLEILPPKQSEMFQYLLKKFWVHGALLLSQSRIAKDCGVTRQYVNTCLKKFERDLLIRSIYKHRYAKTYILHDILRTREFKLRFSYIFKVSINEDIVLDSNLENYYKEVNSQPVLNYTVYRRELTPSKEIRNYINRATTNLATEGNLTTNVALNSRQQGLHIKSLLSSVVEKVAAGNLTWIDYDVMPNQEVSKVKGLNIISKTANLKNFKDKKGRV